jgi:hypothetical protein
MAIVLRPWHIWNIEHPTILPDGAPCGIRWKPEAMAYLELRRHGQSTRPH